MARQHNVVDLFSGCGGLSLGFDLVQRDDAKFRTVMALDNCEPAIRCFNFNHRQLHPGFQSDAGLVSDLTWFNDETEILAYYLDHYARLVNDKALRKGLEGLQPDGLTGFHRSLKSLDREYIAQLRELRSEEGWKIAAKEIAPGAGSLAIVKRWFRRLEVPTGWGKNPTLPNIVWGEPDSDSATESDDGTDGPESEIISALRKLWSSERDQLRDATNQKGRGQHTTVARKVSSVVDFIESSAGDRLFDIWINWRARRDSLRERFFTNSANREQVSKLYSGKRVVKVLLGGPPVILRIQ